VVKASSALVLIALLLFQSKDLIADEQAWKIAGDATGGVFNDVRQTVPDPKDYSAFYFVDLPMMLNGVPTFQNSLPPGIQRIYDNDTIDASAVTCDYLRGQAALPRYHYIFRFKGDGAQLLPGVARCR
jgi:hypothetical protein